VPHYPWKPIPGSSHEVLLSKIEARGPGLTLLDLGCGIGELGRRIRAQCVYLAGIDADPAAAREAAGLFDRVVAEPLPGALASFASERFGVVVAGDVLEHVADPGAVLDGVASLLSPGGLLLVSLPNIANVTVRISLLAGRFDYAPRGILDASHLRFFTKSTGRALLESHGFRVAGTTATAMPAELALPALGKAPLSPFVHGTALALARVWPTLFGYQFIFEAVPA